MKCCRWCGVEGVAGSYCSELCEREAGADWRAEQDGDEERDCYCNDNA